MTTRCCLLNYSPTNLNEKTEFKSSHPKHPQEPCPRFDDGRDNIFRGITCHRRATRHRWPEAAPGRIAAHGLDRWSSVNSWTDMSGFGNHATKTAGTPIYKTGALNGHPVIRFNSNVNSDFGLSARFRTSGPCSVWSKIPIPAITSCWETAMLTISIRVTPRYGTLLM